MRWMILAFVSISCGALLAAIPLPPPATSASRNIPDFTIPGGTGEAADLMYLRQLARTQTATSKAATTSRPADILVRKLPEPTGPEWSKNVQGVRLSATPRGWINWQTSFFMTVQCWYGGKDIYLNLDDPSCWSWEVRDDAGRVVPPTKGPVIPLWDRPVLPGWKFLRDGVSFPVELRMPCSNTGLGAETASLDTLYFYDQSWKLAPGSYTLRGTCTGLSKPGRNIPPESIWAGKIELPPVTLGVYKKVDRQTLVTAAAELRKQSWPDKGALYRALANLIPPGAYRDDLLAVLPMAPNSNAILNYIPTPMYMLDGDYFADPEFLTDSQSRSVLTKPLRIITRAEFITKIGAKYPNVREILAGVDASSTPPTRPATAAVTSSTRAVTSSRPTGTRTSAPTPADIEERIKEARRREEERLSTMPVPK